MHAAILATSVLSTRDLPAANDHRTLVYDAPPECPKAHAFDAEVEKRAPGAGPTMTGASVTITGSTAAGYDGRLVLEGLVRDVHAETCGETMQALALAVAMAALDETPEPVEPRPPVASAGAYPPEQPVASGLAQPDGRARPVIGVGLGGTSGVGPGLAAGLAIFGGLDVGRQSIRVGIGGARSSTISTDLGSVRFTRVALYVDGCPISVRRVAFELSPCARFDGGVLRGSGESLENAETTTLPWLAISAGARLRFDMTPALFVEGEARAVVPLLRHGFFVRPSDSVYRVPVVAAEAFVSVGHRFSK